MVLDLRHVIPSAEFSSGGTSRNRGGGGWHPSAPRGDAHASLMASWAEHEESMAWISVEVTAVDEFPVLMTIWLADEVSTAISPSTW